jgi:hypothetical protein
VLPGAQGAAASFTQRSVPSRTATSWSAIAS